MSAEGNDRAERDIGELFMAIVEYAQVLGIEKINELPGCWEHEDDDLFFAMNGHTEPKIIASGEEIPGFHAYLRFNGWPAALICPYGGCVVGGLEDDLILRVNAARSRIQGGRNDRR